VAQYNLGNLYGSGRGVPQDFRQAMAWYRKAAAQDYALAGASLGYAYDVGRGVAQDPAQAANWYRKAADDGTADAQYSIGRLYQQGRGVPRISSRPTSGSPWRSRGMRPPRRPNGRERS